MTVYDTVTLKLTAWEPAEADRMRAAFHSGSFTFCGIAFACNSAVEEVDWRGGLGGPVSVFTVEAMHINGNYLGGHVGLHDERRDGN